MKKLSAFIKETVTFMAGGAYNLLGRDGWGKGDALFVQTGADGSQQVVSDPLLIAMPIVTSASALTTQKNKKFQDVFNSWLRIAYANRDPKNQPSELTAWSYDAASDHVQCTVNSVSTVGFISPNAYDNYTFEVIVSSTDGDDDAIGLCVAYLPNADGTADALFLYRVAASNIVPADSDSVYAFSLVMNPDSTNRASTVLAGTSAGLHFPDGTAMPAKINTNGGHGGWDTLGEVRLKVVREGSVLTCSTSDKGSTALVSSFSFDLNSRADTKKFVAPGRIGYVCYSQVAATFNVVQQPGSKEPILDTTDGSVWKWENGNWVQYAAGSASLTGLIKRGRLYSSTFDRNLYFAFDDGILTLVSQINPPSS